MGASITIGTTVLNGKKVPHVVDQKTMSNDATIDEAINLGYVVGRREQIEGNVKGVIKAMVAGISQDGNGRKIDEMFSIQPSIRGAGADVTDELDRNNIKVVTKARALKKMKIDTSNWSITVEGSSGTIDIRTISTGEKTSEVVIGEDVNINGFGLLLDENSTLTWSVPEMDISGTVSADKLTSEWTRITIDKTALYELASAQYNGKTIEFVLHIGNDYGRKSAILAFN